MRIFSVEAVGNYLGVIGAAAIIVGAAGMSVALMDARADAVSSPKPAATTVAWHAPSTGSASVEAANPRF